MNSIDGSDSAKSSSDSVNAFRIGLSCYLLYYYLGFLFDLKYFFSDEGMVNRDLLSPFDFTSVLFLFPGNPFLFLFYFVTLGLALLLALGKLSRPWLALLFVLNLSFHHANPYIIHEPQQITNLLLLLFVLFLPIKKNVPADPFIVKTIIVCLGVYYFVAGVKKLPDPAWIHGHAVGELLSWSGLARGQWGGSLSHYVWLNKLITYSSLAFELTFIFVCLSRWRRAWLCFAVFFHLGIFLFMEVGSFSAIMLVWCLIALKVPVSTSGSEST